MAYEQNDNSGSLFKNDRKESDNHPDYNGSALIDGTEYWMNAWLKESKNGRKWMSFSFKPKEQQQESRQPQSSQPYHAPVSESDIPF